MKKEEKKCDGLQFFGYITDNIHAAHIAPSNLNKSTRRDLFVDDEGGYTTITVAMSLLLSVVLLVSAAQVKWVQGEAPSIQFVADSAALSAENAVADFYTISRVADAIILSVSLVALTMYGTGIVLCCIPGGAGAGAEIMSLAARVTSIRDRISDSAKQALNSLQKALPYICMVNATTTISKNTEESHANYVGTAIPFPMQGDSIFPDPEDITDEAKEFEENGKEISESVEEAEEYLQAMKDAKNKAYESDCGANPNYCMYQRASTLANMNGASNPYYASVDSWSFEVALKRARAYYAARQTFDSLDGSDSEAKTRLECRKLFYQYASKTLEEGYVRGEGETYEAYFPTLPKNTDQMKQTSMYSDAHWWASSDGKLHGTSSCTKYCSAGGAGRGSLKQLDSGQFSSCDECGLLSSTLGKIALPSTSINNGFEYHYKIVAEQAEIYEDNCKKAAEAERKAKELAEESFETYADAMKKASSKRYDPKPPGRYGCIAVVTDTSSYDAPSTLTSSLMGTSASIGTRVAISGAALGEDIPQNGQNLISSMLDGLCQDAKDSGSQNLLGEGADKLMDLWGWALSSYTNGSESLVSGVESTLNSIPVIGETGVGTWAKNAFTDVISSLGLEPPKLSSPKPLTINTKYILEQDNQDLAQALQNARDIANINLSQDSFDFETLGKVIEIDIPQSEDIPLPALDEILEYVGGG